MKKETCPFVDGPWECEQGVIPSWENGYPIVTDECWDCEIFNCGGKITTPEIIAKIEREHSRTLEKLNARVSKLMEQKRKIMRQTVSLESALESGRVSLEERPEFERVIEDNRLWIRKTENILSGLQAYLEIGQGVRLFEESGQNFKS